MFNSVINFRRVTHFRLCLLETQVSPGHIMPHTFLGMCCYKGLPMASCTTLFVAEKKKFFLQYVYSYVASGYHFLQILLYILCR